MKKYLCFLLIAVTLWTVGCTPQDDTGKVRFYYPKLEYAYGNADGVISMELREKNAASVQGLLSLYLAGPEDLTLDNPFPENLSVLSVYTEKDILHITVSDHMAQYTGASLILACACLGRTGMDLTGTTSVRIRCNSLLLDGKSHITIDASSILYLDEVSDAFQE